MGVTNQTSNNFIDTIDRMVDAAISKAKYDKTITATIVKCEDAVAGKYRVKYKENYLPAYSLDTSISYSNGQSVFIQVPESDFGKTKTIIGLAKGTEREAQNIGSIVDSEDKHYFELSKTIYFTSFGDNYKEITMPAVGHELVIYDERGGTSDNNIYAQFLDPNKNVKKFQNFIDNYNTLNSIYEKVRIKCVLSLQTHISNTTGVYGIKITSTRKDGSTVAIDFSSQDFTGTPFTYTLTHKENLYFELAEDAVNIKVSLYTSNDITLGEDDYIKANMEWRLAAYSADITTNITQLRIRANTLLFTNNISEIPISADYLKAGQLIVENSQLKLIKWYVTSSDISTQSDGTGPWYKYQTSPVLQREGPQQILNKNELNLFDKKIHIFATIDIGNNTTIVSNILTFSANSGAGLGDPAKMVREKYNPDYPPSSTDVNRYLKMVSSEYLTINSEEMRAETYCFGVLYNGSIIKNGAAVPQEVGQFDNEIYELTWKQVNATNNAPASWLLDDHDVPRDDFVIMQLVNAEMNAALVCTIKGKGTQTVDGKTIQKEEYFGSVSTKFLITSQEAPISTDLDVNPTVVSVKYDSSGYWGENWDGFSKELEVSEDNQKKREILITAQYHEGGTNKEPLNYCWYYNKKSGFKINGVTTNNIVKENDVEYSKYPNYYKVVTKEGQVTVKISQTHDFDAGQLIVVAQKSNATITSDPTAIIQFNYRREFTTNSSAKEIGGIPYQDASGTAIIPEALETIYYIKNGADYRTYRNKYDSNNSPILNDSSKWFEAMNGSQAGTFTLDKTTNNNIVKNAFELDETKTLFSRPGHGSEISVLKEILKGNDPNNLQNIHSLLTGSFVTEQVKDETTGQVTGNFIQYFKKGIGLFIVENESAIKPKWNEVVNYIVLAQSGCVDYTRGDTARISFKETPPTTLEYVWTVHQNLIRKADNVVETAKLISIKGAKNNQPFTTADATISFKFSKDVNFLQYDLAGFGVSCIIRNSSTKEILAYGFFPIDIKTALDEPSLRHYKGKGNEFTEITDANGATTGYIYTNAMHAGRFTGTPDIDGRQRGWSGVIAGEIGDVNQSGHNAQEAFYGLRGYKEGVVTYELGTDDGHVRMGRVDEGYIEIIPGTSPLIRSGNYSEGSGGKGITINFSNAPFIKYGNGNFEVNENGILSAKGAKIQGLLSSTYENYWNDTFPFTVEGDTKATLKVGKFSESTNEVGFAITSKRVISTTLDNGTEVVVPSTNAADPGYVIKKATGTCTYVNTSITDEGFTFGRYAGTIEDGDMKDDGMIEGIRYDFNNGLYVSGTIRARKGIIGGWTIQSDSITSPGGGLILKANGEIIGYTPQPAKGTAYEGGPSDNDYGDYLKIQRDTISWAQPQSGTSGTHIEKQWIQTPQGEWRQVDTVVKDPLTYQVTSSMTSSNGTVSLAAPNGVSIASSGGGNLSATANSVTTSIGQKKSIETTVENTSGETSDGKNLLARSVLKLCKTVVGEATCIYQEINGERTYFKGSISKKDIGHKACKKIECTFEASCKWITDINPNTGENEGVGEAYARSIAKDWKAADIRAKKPAYDYKVESSNVQNETASILGRAPDKVTFKSPVEGEYTKVTKQGTAQKVSGFSYDIQEQYPPNFNDGQNNLILHYTLITDDNDEVLSLEYPNGVTTYFVFEEAEGE